MDQTRRRSLARALVLWGGWALFLWQLRHPFVRFAGPFINDLLGLVLGLSLPWCATIETFRIGRWWSKAIVVASALPLMIYAFVFLLGSAISVLAYQNGHDLSFEHFGETPWRGSYVRFYRTNGGATTDYGVVIRHETTLLPGILIVRNVDSWYHCFSLNGTASKDGIVIMDDGAECRAFTGPQHEHRLKPFLYF